MIKVDTEFFSSPYYFFLKEKEKNYNLYVSSENTITEARKKDKMISIPKDKLEDVKKYISKLLNSKKTKNTDEIEGEIDELVNLDGAMMNSKIPILNPVLHPRKTMDQTVAAARQTNDPIMRGYRTYFGESEISEVDMSDAFGYEETKDLDGEDTYKYFIEKLDMEPSEAEDRTRQQGKDPFGKKDDKSPYKNDKNFVTRATLSEIQKNKMIKVLEDMITNKKNTDDADISKKEVEKSSDELPLLLKRNLKSLIKNAEKHGLSKKDLIKIIGSE